MINIGIDKDQGLVYEGDSDLGRPVWPAPVITPAKFVLSGEEIKAEDSSHIFGYRFREDSFEAISRIRRGRFYCADQSQPRQWRVTRHPSMPFDYITPDVHGFNKRLETFYGSSIWHKYIKDQKILPQVLLGVDDRFTIWSIVNIEAISTGEDLVTLKSRNSFGILPQLKSSEIHEAYKAKINETLERFSDEAHKASPVSVIDRGRDAITYVLLAYFNLNGHNAQDLGKLVKKLEEEKLAVAANAANLVARLHARAKPSEQEKRELRPIREQDAELVIQCVGTVLCELGFADWP